MEVSTHDRIHLRIGYISQELYAAGDSTWKVNKEADLPTLHIDMNEARMKTERNSFKQGRTLE
jgi:hypothetical protein